jgi:hypothetical protein
MAHTANTIILMASLLNPTTKETTGAGGKVAITRISGKEKGKDKSLDNGVGPPVPNPEIQTGWKLPPGVFYSSLFAGPLPNLGDGLSCCDSPQLKAPKLTCNRFQCMGMCRLKCFLVHMVHSKIGSKMSSMVGTCFKSIYRPWRQLWTTSDSNQIYWCHGGQPNSTSTHVYGGSNPKTGDCPPNPPEEQWTSDRSASPSGNFWMSTTLCPPPGQLSNK